MREISNGERKRSVKKPAELVKVAESLKRDIVSQLNDVGIELLDEYNLNKDRLHPLVVKVKSLLEDSLTKSQSPLKVSLMGPFSSGKTITLCTILNQPNLLPRASQPTTGNVVEVQVIPPQNSDVPRFMQCHLFSLLELKDMLRDYYVYLQRDFRDLARLPESFVLRERIHMLCQDINKLLTDKWTEHHRDGILVRGLTHLAHLYFTLLTVKNYLQKYTEIRDTTSLILELPYESQSKKTSDWLIAVAMMDMEWDSKTTNPGYLEERASRLSTVLPEKLDDFKAICQRGEITNEALRTLFPLYRRIILTQELNIKDWGGIERVSFVDIPGTGSANRRDIYLCLKELPQVHVNMLFFSADKPTMEAAQPLIGMVMEAKQHLQRLSVNRLIPVINFFDTYAQVPDDVSASEQAQTDASLRRVRTFFSKQRLDDVTDGPRQGFDVFDQSILGELFPAQEENWSYYLLSPSVAIDETLLSGKEKQYVATYNETKGRYGQLLQDLKTSIRYLKDQENRQQHTVEIAKYRRLQEALEAYQEDGGIDYLREQLIEKLKQNGMNLILEDAIVPLNDALILLYEQLISPLREGLDLDNLSSNTQDAVANKDARNMVIALWDRMRELTSHWVSAGQIKLVHRGHQVMEPRNKTDNEDVDPLKLCEAEVLSTVLQCDFWHTWAEKWIDPANNQSTPLKELTEHYRQLEQILDAWTTQAISQTLMDTLNKLDHEMVVLDKEKPLKQSFRGLREELENNYLRTDKLTSEEKNELRKWFGLSSLADKLRERLDEQKKQQMAENVAEISTKVPFNEKQDFNWTAVEMMKVQRQIILTLQRRVAHQFAFYDSVFSQELKNELNARLQDFYHSIDKRKEEYLQKNGVFDRLADIPLSEEEREQQSVSEMSFKQKRQQAQQRATLILEAWDKLI